MINKLLSNVDYLIEIIVLQRNLVKAYNWKHIVKATEDFILS